LLLLTHAHGSAMRARLLAAMRVRHFDKAMRFRLLAEKASGVEDGGWPAGPGAAALKARPVGLL